MYVDGQALKGPGLEGPFSGDAGSPGILGFGSRELSYQNQRTSVLESLYLYWSLLEQLTTQTGYGITSILDFSGYVSLFVGYQYSSDAAEGKGKLCQGAQGR